MEGSWYCPLETIDKENLKETDVYYKKDKGADQQ